MSFWSGNSEIPGTSISLKRSYRFIGTLRLNKSTTGGVKDVNRSGPMVSNFNQGEDIKNFLIHSFEKPTFDANVVDLGQNPRNGEYDYTIGKVGWKEVTVQIYDTLADGPESKGMNPAKMIWEWLEGIGYDAQSMAGLGGRRGDITSFATRLKEANSATLLITVIDADGERIINETKR